LDAGRFVAEQAITAATNQIDHQLHVAPDVYGESRADGRRVLFVHPLGLIYRIPDGSRTVLVVHVWQVFPQDP
jgi:hypothetical protein